MPKAKKSNARAGNEIGILAARWTRLAAEIQAIAIEVDGGGAFRQSHRRRVAVLVAREAVALGVDMPLDAVEVITGSWSDEAGQDSRLPPSDEKDET